MANLSVTQSSTRPLKKKKKKTVSIIDPNVLKILANVRMAEWSKALRSGRSLLL